MLEARCGDVEERQPKGSIMNSGTLYRRSAFTDNPKGGNPAGVWVGETPPSVEVMQRSAAEVGYSETAFAI